MNHHASVALIATSGIASPRARAYARELCQKGSSPAGMGYSNAWNGVSNATMSNASIASMAAGMGGYSAPPPGAENVSVWRGRGLGVVVPQHDADDNKKNQISRWALAAEKDDQDAYRSAVHALSSVNPWGPSGPNWYTSVANGGWYAYSDVTTMLSTTVAQRHPEWLTAVSAVVGAEADVSFGGGAVGASVGSPTTVDVDGISAGIVNTGGDALAAAGDVASGGAVAAQKTWAEWLTAYKWLLLGGTVGLVAIGGGYAYVYGRGARRTNAPRPRTVTVRRTSAGKRFSGRAA